MPKMKLTEIVAKQTDVFNLLDEAQSEMKTALRDLDEAKEKVERAFSMLEDLPDDADDVEDDREKDEPASET